LDLLEPEAHVMKPTLREDVTSILAITFGAVVGAGLIARLLPGRPVEDAAVRVEVRKPDLRIVQVPVLKKAGPDQPSRNPDGYRAVTVPVDDVIGVNGPVQPGALVDVMVTLDKVGTGADAVTRIVLQNVPVLGNDLSTSRDENGQAVTTRFVTMLVTPRDAEKLAMAETNGRLHLALRRGVASP
jgi:Flp pilus assembly protein CpaB